MPRALSRTVCVSRPCPLSNFPADAIFRPPKILIWLAHRNDQHHDLSPSFQPSRLLPHAPLHGLDRKHEQRPRLCLQTYVTRPPAGTRFISPLVTSVPMLAWPSHPWPIIFDHFSNTSQSAQPVPAPWRSCAARVARLPTTATRRARRLRGRATAPSASLRPKATRPPRRPTFPTPLAPSANLEAGLQTTFFFLLPATNVLAARRRTDDEEVWREGKAVKHEHGRGTFMTTITRTCIFFARALFCFVLLFFISRRRFWGGTQRFRLSAFSCDAMRAKCLGTYHCFCATSGLRCRWQPCIEERDETGRDGTREGALCIYTHIHISVVTNNRTTNQTKQPKYLPTGQDNLPTHRQRLARA